MWVISLSHDGWTYLKCSLVMSPLLPKCLLIRTIPVVKMLKRTPNPRTTTYPIPTVSGESPPKKDSEPWYCVNVGGIGPTLTPLMIVSGIFDIVVMFVRQCRVTWTNLHRQQNNENCRAEKFTVNLSCNPHFWHRTWQGKILCDKIRK